MSTGFAFGAFLITGDAAVRDAMRRIAGRVEENCILANSVGL